MKVHTETHGILSAARRVTVRLPDGVEATLVGWSPNGNMCRVWLAGRYRSVPKDDVDIVEHSPAERKS